MYVYSTCMQRGSLRLHVVNLVPNLSVVPVPKVITIAIVERLLYEISLHIVAVPIERLVVIDLMVLHIHYGIVSLPHSGSWTS